MAFPGERAQLLESVVANRRREVVDAEVRDNPMAPRIIHDEAKVIRDERARNEQRDNTNSQPDPNEPAPPRRGILGRRVFIPYNNRTQLIWRRDEDGTKHFDRKSFYEHMRGYAQVLKKSVTLASVCAHAFGMFINEENAKLIAAAETDEEVLKYCVQAMLTLTVNPLHGKDLLYLKEYAVHLYMLIGFGYDHGVRCLSLLPEEENALLRLYQQPVINRPSMAQRIQNQFCSFLKIDRARLDRFRNDTIWSDAHIALEQKMQKSRDRCKRSMKRSGLKDNTDASFNEENNGNEKPANTQSSLHSNSADKSGVKVPKTEEEKNSAERSIDPHLERHNPKQGGGSEDYNRKDNKYHPSHEERDERNNDGYNNNNGSGNANISPIKQTPVIPGAPGFDSSNKSRKVEKEEKEKGNMKDIKTPGLNTSNMSVDSLSTPQTWKYGGIPTSAYKTDRTDEEEKEEKQHATDVQTKRNKETKWSWQRDSGKKEPTRRKEDEEDDIYWYSKQNQKLYSVEYIYIITAHEWTLANFRKEDPEALYNHAVILSTWLGYLNGVVNNVRMGSKMFNRYKGLVADLIDALVFVWYLRYIRALENRNRDKKNKFKRMLIQMFAHFRAWGIKPKDATYILQRICPGAMLEPFPTDQTAAQNRAVVYDSATTEEPTMQSAASATMQSVANQVGANRISTNPTTPTQSVITQHFDELTASKFEKEKSNQESKPTQRTEEKAQGERSAKPSTHRPKQKKKTQSRLPNFLGLPQDRQHKFYNNKASAGFPGDFGGDGSGDSDDSKSDYNDDTSDRDEDDFSDDWFNQWKTTLLSGRGKGRANKARKTDTEDDDDDDDDEKKTGDRDNFTHRPHDYRRRRRVSGGKDDDKPNGNPNGDGNDENKDDKNDDDDSKDDKDKDKKLNQWPWSKQGAQSVDFVRVDRYDPHTEHMKLMGKERLHHARDQLTAKFSGEQKNVTAVDVGFSGLTFIFAVLVWWRIWGEIAYGGHEDMATQFILSKITGTARENIQTDMMANDALILKKIKDLTGWIRDTYVQEYAYPRLKERILSWRVNLFALRTRVSKAFDTLNHQIQIYNSLVKALHPLTAARLYIQEHDQYALIWRTLQAHGIDVQINHRLDEQFREPRSLQDLQRSLEELQKRNKFLATQRRIALPQNHGVFIESAHQVSHQSANSNYDPTRTNAGATVASLNTRTRREWWHNHVRGNRLPRTANNRNQWNNRRFRQGYRNRRQGRAFNNARRPQNNRGRGRRRGFYTGNRNRSNRGVRSVQRRGYNPRGRPRRNNQGRRNNNRNRNNQRRNNNGRRNNNNGNNRQTGRVVCYRCGDTGHVSTKCNASQKKVRKYQQRKRRAFSARTRNAPNNQNNRNNGRNARNRSHNVRRLQTRNNHGNRSDHANRRNNSRTQHASRAIHFRTNNQQSGDASIQRIMYHIRHRGDPEQYRHHTEENNTDETASL